MYQSEQISNDDSKSGIINIGLETNGILKKTLECFTGIELAAVDDALSFLEWVNLFFD